MVGCPAEKPTASGLIRRQQRASVLKQAVAELIQRCFRGFDRSFAFGFGQLPLFGFVVPRLLLGIRRGERPVFTRSSLSFRVRCPNCLPRADNCCRE